MHDKFLKCDYEMFRPKRIDYIRGEKIPLWAQVFTSQSFRASSSSPFLDEEEYGRIP